MRHLGDDDTKTMACTVVLSGMHEHSFPAMLAEAPEAVPVLVAMMRSGNDPRVRHTGLSVISRHASNEENTSVLFGGFEVLEALLDILRTLPPPPPTPAAQQGASSRKRRRSGSSKSPMAAAAAEEAKETTAPNLEDQSRKLAFFALSMALTHSADKRLWILQQGAYLSYLIRYLESRNTPEITDLLAILVKVGALDLAGALSTSAAALHTAKPSCLHIPNNPPPPKKGPAPA